MKKVLLTGGSGFVGRNIARCLRNMGYDVLTPTHTELNIADLGQFFTYQQIHQHTALVHCAVSGQFGSMDPIAFANNIKMFENIAALDDRWIPTFFIGSGAEFDRRFPIELAEEDNVFKCWPVDLYGLYKNIICRRANNEEVNFPYLLRLFGCFGADEPDFRFIAKAIRRVRSGEPIEIVQNRKMDFFFVEDVAQVIDYILCNPYTHRNINLTYFRPHDERYTLSDIAEVICAKLKIQSNIVILNKEMDKPYTGCANRLSDLDYKPIGLEGGIQKIINEYDYILH